MTDKQLNKLMIIIHLVSRIRTNNLDDKIRKDDALEILRGIRDE